MSPRGARGRKAKPQWRQVADQEERSRRRVAGLCFVCGQGGHFAKNCPEGAATVASGSTQGVSRAHTAPSQAPSRSVHGAVPSPNSEDPQVARAVAEQLRKLLGSLDTAGDVPLGKQLDALLAGLDEPKPAEEAPSAAEAGPSGGTEEPSGDKEPPYGYPGKTSPPCDVAPWSPSEGPKGGLPYEPLDLIIADQTPDPGCVCFPFPRWWRRRKLARAMLANHDHYVEQRDPDYLEKLRARVCHGGQTLAMIAHEVQLEFGVPTDTAANRKAVLRATLKVFRRMLKNDHLTEVIARDIWMTMELVFTPTWQFTLSQEVARTRAFTRRRPGNRRLFC